MTKTGESTKPTNPLLFVKLHVFRGFDFGFRVQSTARVGGTTRDDQRLDVTPGFPTQVAEDVRAGGIAGAEVLTRHVGGQQQGNEAGESLLAIGALDTAPLAAGQGPDGRVGALDGERFAQDLLHVPQAVRAVGGFLLQHIQHIDIKRRVSHGKDTEKTRCRGFRGTRRWTGVRKRCGFRG